LIVQTVPSEFVHVPARAAGPDVGAVAHAPISTIKVHAKTIRRECCNFMAGILPCDSVTRQAQIAAKRLVVNGFAFDVQRLRGPDTATSCSDAKTKLVEAELEMVRANWLPEHSAAVRRFCCLSRLDRI